MTHLAWLALLAPLPEGAVPRRQLVGVEPQPEAIAGWENLVLDLSNAGDGLRVVHMILDGTGKLIGASDHVLIPQGLDDLGRERHRHQSIGGRFEPDGSFRGTCWTLEGVANEDGEFVDPVSTPSQPTPEQVERLRALADELLRRAPPGRRG